MQASHERRKHYTVVFSETSPTVECAETLSMGVESRLCGGGGGSHLAGMKFQFSKKVLEGCLKTI